MLKAAWKETTIVHDGNHLLFAGFHHKQQKECQATCAESNKNGAKVLCHITIFVVVCSSTVNECYFLLHIPPVKMVTIEDCQDMGPLVEAALFLLSFFPAATVFQLSDL